MPPGPSPVFPEGIRAAIDVDHQARAATTDRASVRQRLPQLTPREQEVMELLIGGPLPMGCQRTRPRNRMVLRGAPPASCMSQ